MLPLRYLSVRSLVGSTCLIDSLSVRTGFSMTWAKMGNPRSLGTAALERILDHLPGRVSAAVDLRRPQLWDSWGGPLNGQRGRQALLRDIVRRVSFKYVVETGTYRGVTTQFLADVSGLPIHSCERAPRYFEYSRRRLANRDVHLELADSRAFLSQLHVELPALFYLDAHWGDQLPLRDEVAIIAQRWNAAVVVIDDFRVKGDDGYGYDDYGPGRVLDESLLPMQYLSNWVLAYPALGSDAETGARRGCAVLVSPIVGEDVVRSPLLRATRI
jgi:predicted O-methyltransferase YrrM